MDQNIWSYLPLNQKKIAEFDFVYTLTSTNINQSAPNLVEMYMTLRSRMNYSMDLIRVIWTRIRKTTIIDFVYALASANINQSAPNFARICITNRSRVRLIMNPLGLEQPELFALELGKLLHSTV